MQAVLSERPTTLLALSRERIRKHEPAAGDRKPKRGFFAMPHGNYRIVFTNVAQELFELRCPRHSRILSITK